MQNGRSIATRALPAILLAAISTVALASAPEAGAVKFGKRTLKPGMRGKDVRVLQRNLTRLKLRTRSTAYFGRQTRKNVKRLEARRGWRVDGRVQRPDAKRIKGLIEQQRERKRARRLTAGAQAFPVPGPHNYGGASAKFGAPRSGHSHQGQDVFAACGEPLLSAQSGNVKAKGYQGSGAGHYLVIVGVDGLDYVYMHLQKASWTSQGTLVTAGTQIGKVGASGNASGCHLHFELWSSPGWYSGGGPFDPLPALLYWDSYS
jgi:murein DD-endopeptidase MepM/ murein hydrolase activator NlpD